MSNPLFSGPLPPAFSKGEQPWPGPASATNLPAAIAYALAEAADSDRTAECSPEPFAAGYRQQAAHLRALVETAAELERVREDARQVLLTFSEIARDCKDMTLPQVDSMAKAINKILYWPTPPA